MNNSDTNLSIKVNYDGDVNVKPVVRVTHEKDIVKILIDLELTRVSSNKYNGELCKNMIPKKLKFDVNDGGTHDR